MTIDKLIDDLSIKAATHAARAAALEGVTIATKENGDDYRRVGAKIVTGARLYGRTLVVSYRYPGPCYHGTPVEHITVPCTAFCFELPEDDPRRGPEPVNLRSYELTPAELRELIAKEAATERRAEARARENAEWLEAHAAGIMAEIDDLTSRAAELLARVPEETTTRAGIAKAITDTITWALRDEI